jgi:hypothetical protein
MQAQVRTAFPFLADGRLFFRRDDGSILEADAFERRFAAELLNAHASGRMDPARGLQLLPPSDS